MASTASTAFADSVDYGREGHYYSYGLFDGASLCVMGSCSSTL
jgi:hypothetical protein